MNNNIPEEYKPITMLGYIGYQILFSLPIIGIIVIVAFSLGATKNINVRNFAKANLFIIIVTLLLSIIAIVIAVVAFGGLAGLASYLQTNGASTYQSSLY